jgi:hypothetical protein
MNGQQAGDSLGCGGLPSNQYGGIRPTKSNGEFIEALRSLPIWIVVRLCTGDDEVVEYYNNL